MEGRESVHAKVMAEVEGNLNQLTMQLTELRDTIGQRTEMADLFIVHLREFCENISKQTNEFIDNLKSKISELPLVSELPIHTIDNILAASRRKVSQQEKEIAELKRKAIALDEELGETFFEANVPDGLPFAEEKTHIERILAAQIEVKKSRVEGMKQTLQHVRILEKELRIKPIEISYEKLSSITQQPQTSSAEIQTRAVVSTSAQEQAESKSVTPLPPKRAKLTMPQNVLIKYPGWVVILHEDYPLVCIDIKKKISIQALLSSKIEQDLAEVAEGGDAWAAKIDTIRMTNGGLAILIEDRFTDLWLKDLVDKADDLNHFQIKAAAKLDYKYTFTAWCPDAECEWKLFQRLVGAKLKGCSSKDWKILYELQDRRQESWRGKTFAFIADNHMLELWQLGAKNNEQGDPTMIIAYKATGRKIKIRKAREFNELDLKLTTNTLPAGQVDAEASNKELEFRRTRKDLLRKIIEKKKRQDEEDIRKQQEELNAENPASNAAVDMQTE